jgi:putative nucleotidyltransferase with HDIG domain
MIGKLRWLRGLEHWRLVRKGMACGRIRRTAERPAWLATVDHSPWIRALLYSFFAGSVVLLSFWQQEHPSGFLWLLGLLVAASSFLLLHLELSEVCASNSKLLLVFGSMLINVLVSKAVYVWTIKHQQWEFRDAYYYVPTALAPMLVTVLLGARAGVYTVVVTALLGAFLVNQSLLLLALNLVAGCTAVYFTRNARRRRDLLWAGMAVGLAGLAGGVALGMASRTPGSYLWEEALLSLASGIATSLLIGAFLPLFEDFLGVQTALSWVELADLNHPLLRRLMMEAPGTYHHSLMVANLAEAAAVPIGANPTLCRVMAYFHDVGKLTNPQYFCENMVPGNNPHDALSPSMSALVIISHVKEGVDLALQHHLPRPVVEAIQQHHGDGLVYYFYHRAKRMTQDAQVARQMLRLPGADVEVEEGTFRYPGPKPQSKEIGILMLADAVESASRCLEKPTPQRIEELVEEIVWQRITDRQLDECGLTLKEIWKVAARLSSVLKTAMHSRLQYPKNETRNAASFQPAKRGSGLDVPASGSIAESR